MKTLQGSLIIALSLAAGASQAEGTSEGLGLMPGQTTALPPQPVASIPVQPSIAAQPQALTFPPSSQVGNQMQYPGIGQSGLQFPNQAYIQQQQAYPYSSYGNYYAYPVQSYAYPYAQNYYNPYAMNRMSPYAMRPPVPPQPQKKEVKPWGDTRYIWPDFYTDFTGDVWDKMINAPSDMGYMPGGWRFPSFSSPDPVTVGDAVTNQFPPIMEEAGNFVNFAN
ncbi:MAG TPA: hypothetical protein PLE99_11480 [Candidatus Thiothrix moscowensis]|uniref:hypothetical protein n=1 Tax=unclassified Thiothrix TaxID=2636184 RepID=UPI0025FC16F5|nr:MULTISPECIES: hypothetical protein [unclassified Thiothrix]HRJ53380.1 hypothetical protein [Candidatus Thiothrix moscowensis]HRJ94643.1 hypothetical protein [Candidatus Thiothrix moscowensis]